MTLKFYPLFYLYLCIKYYVYIFNIIFKFLGIGDWGLGIGDWGLGDWGLGPIPNPQSPIPNPQSPIPQHICYKNFMRKIK
jgi:hypothetical protein